MRNTTALKSKSKTHSIHQIDDRNFEVTSGSTNKVYTVFVLENGASCTCDWAKYRPAENQGRCGCSHVLSVMAYIEEGKSRAISAFTSWESAERQHRPIMDIGDGILLTTRKA